MHFLPSSPPPSPVVVQVKGVSFFGEDDEYVCSGSDCGHVFLWDKAHGTVVLWEEADAEVVNCLEPHPRLPLVLATSGGLSCIAEGVGGQGGRQASMLKAHCSVVGGSMCGFSDVATCLQPHHACHWCWQGP